MLYLDHAATTPVRPEVRAVMAPYLGERFGNPSGLHAVSRRAKNAIEAARERAAEILGARRPLEIVFTGGGSEADNLAVKGPAIAMGADTPVVVGATEHDAVLKSARFLERTGHPVTVVGVDRQGRVDPAEVATAASGRRPVVSVMTVNNETGVVQPIEDLVAAVRAVAPAAIIHTDAVQAFGFMELDVAALDVDLLTLSAHKFGGPQGVGLLYVRDGIELEPVIHGGGQELGRRSGTHAVAAIVGMVAAMEAAAADREGFVARTTTARDVFETELRQTVPGLEINAPQDARSPHHSHVRFPGVAAETLLVRLDQAGVAAAAGSACHSGAIDISHVLAAMGMTPEAAAECVRFTFGWTTRPEDGRRAAEVVAGVLADLRAAKAEVGR